MEDLWDIGLEEALPHAERIINLTDRAWHVLHAEIPSDMHQSALATIRMMWSDMPQAIAAAGDADRIFDLKRIRHLLLVGFENGFCIGWYLHKNLSGVGGENLLSLINARGERELISGNRTPGVRLEYDSDFLSLYGGTPDVHGYLTVLAHETVQRRDPLDVQTRLITVTTAGFGLGYVTPRTTAVAARSSSL